ncbi:MAG: hypothetical protein Q8O67_30000 [Deltaproteobacteria bacterium]|nr:hypothetical protein [Deltaproteobacteria bacterium]
MKSIIALMLVVATPVLALPDVVSYAARVENDAGIFSGTVAVTFQLFDASVAGTELWSETVASTVVVDGDLVHELGSVELLDDTVLERDDLFLAVTINGDTLSPRLALRAVPYALKAQEAESLSGLSAADVATDAELGALSFSNLPGVPAGFADGVDNDTIATAAAAGGLAVSANAFSIADNGVTLAKMADSSVSSAEVVADSLTAADLATSSVGAAEITNGTITSVEFNSRDEIFRLERGCTGAEGADFMLSTNSTCDRDNVTCAGGATFCRDCNTGVCGQANCAIDVCFNTSFGFVVTQ